MLSKRSQEGYLLIDNRCNEGLPDQMTRWAGIDMPGGRGMFESPTITCPHCQRVIVLNPLRTRARNHCRRCDHYVCDSIECNLACRPVKQVFDELQEQMSKPEQINSTIETLRNSVCGF